MTESLTKCEKCGLDKPESEVKRRTFWPTKAIEFQDDYELGQGVGKLPKWIKTREEMCEQCHAGLAKALEGVI